MPSADPEIDRMVEDLTEVWHDSRWLGDEGVGLYQFLGMREDHVHEWLDVYGPQSVNEALWPYIRAQHERWVTYAPTGECPRTCDKDCTAYCHEGHDIPRKRRHQPEDCPGLRGAYPDMNRHELGGYPAVAGVSEVASLLGVSTQRVNQLRSRKDFPTPIAQLSAGAVWSVPAIRTFLARWERKPGRPRREENA